jgi:hypothetical protein
MKDKVIERIVNKFTSAKFLTAMAVILTTCYLAIVGTITSEQFAPLATMIIGFYFGQSVAKKV